MWRKQTNSPCSKWVILIWLIVSPNIRIKGCAPAAHGGLWWWWQQITYSEKLFGRNKEKWEFLDDDSNSDSDGQTSNKPKKSDDDEHDFDLSIESNNNSSDDEDVPDSPDS